MNSAMKHPIAEMSFFARRNLGRKTVVGCYSGMLFHQNIQGKKQNGRVFQEGALAMSVKQFQTFSGHTSAGMEDSSWNHHSSWIVPAAPICHNISKTCRIFKRSNVEVVVGGKQ